MENLRKKLYLEFPRLLPANSGVSGKSRIWQRYQSIVGFSGGRPGEEFIGLGRSTFRREENGIGKQRDAIEDNTVACYRCGGNGHRASVCPTQLSRNGDQNDRSCYRSGRIGHLQANCQEIFACRPEANSVSAGATQRSQSARTPFKSYKNSSSKFILCKLIS